MTARDDIDWDELRKMLQARDDKKEVMQVGPGEDSGSEAVAPPGLSSDGPGVSKVALPEPVAKRSTTVDGIILCEPVYTAAQLESYAAAIDAILADREGGKA